jgi:uncharacterized delta-60 repeat protein
MKTASSPTAAVTGARLAPRATTLLLALGIHILGFTANATAAPGDLDPEFGTGGRVIIDQAGTEIWNHVLPLPNGDVLVSGYTGYPTNTQNHIIRLNSKGELVPSFGNQGQITLNLGGSIIRDLIALPGGKILAVVRQVATPIISLVRLQSNGSLDTTFGGDGIMGVDNLPSNFDGITGMALDPEGRIVIAGSVTTGGSVAVLKFTQDGYPDTTFSGDGMAKPYVVAGADSVTMAVQQDGKIVIAGYVSAGVDNYNLMVCRVLTDGNLDSSFASAGKLVLDLHGGMDAANAICIRPNGKIVVAGYTRTQPGNNDEYDKSLFVGLDQNGALDNSFGSGGIVEIDVSNAHEEIIAVNLMPDGRIIAGCRAVVGGGWLFAALRLMPDGIPDSTFGSGGIVQIPNPDTYVYARADCMARDASGGILVIGLANTQVGQDGMLVRLLGDPDSDRDGIVDASETGTGIYVSPFNTGTNPNNRDTDGDGLSDGDEAYQYLTNPLVGDTDLDGFLDGYELLTGHSPLIAADHPALVAEVRTAIEFTFTAAIGKSYRIEGSFDLSTWETVEDAIAGNGSVIQRFYTTRDMPKRYFRVEESAP